MRAAGKLILISLVLVGALALPSTAGAAPKPVWLCKPGIEDNPCEPSLRTTLLSPTGQQLGIEKVKAARRPKVDCFYVYPTVSDQPGPQANLEIDPVLRSIALFQAARYSQHCRVFAPVYRQITLAGLGLSGGSGGVTPEMFETAYADVRNAWNNYLRKHNDGRGVVLISHSQGTIHLTRLVQEEIDARRRARRKLVSAMLLGGDVTVREGSDAGGDFEHVEACRSKRQLGCVVAFSTWDANEPVPPDAAYGRTGEPGLEVLCTNPAALRGGSGSLTTIYPSEPFAPGTIAAAIAATSPSLPQVSTPWQSYEGAYVGECSAADDANLLKIAGVGGAPDLTPVLPSFGLHLVDGNIALGNLVDLIGRQAKAFVKTRR
jgi:Protein of unknown function (DUF3089)